MVVKMLKFPDSLSATEFGVFRMSGEILMGAWYYPGGPKLSFGFTGLSYAP